MIVVLSLLGVVLLAGGYGLHWSWTGFPDNGTVWDWLKLVVLPATVALIPLWGHTHATHRTAWRRAFSLFLLALAVLAVGGYGFRWQWTGVRGRTLWDWLEIFLVSFALPLAIALRPSPTAAGGGGAKVDSPSEAGREQAESLPGRTLSAEPVPVDLAVGRTRAGRQEGGRTPRVVLTPLLVVLATAGVVAGLLLGAGMGGFLIARNGQVVRQAPASTGPEPTTTPAVPQSVQVAVAGTQLWTDSGVHLASGQRFSIHASGRVRFAGNGAGLTTGPNGADTPHGNCVLPGKEHHAALIGRIVGTTAGPPFLIGADLTTSARQTGLLLLGINDKGVDNNSGTFVAKIHIGS
jgi:hypothetical protein